MDFFKTWILPTVMGAIIGYFTNWLAIKMLFRPLKPVYLGRLRLPFTPGILPRERERLARSVGDTVSRELLTPEVFKSRLGEPALRDKVELSVRGVVDQLLANDASALMSGLADLGAGISRGEAEVPEAAALAGASLRAVFASDEFRRALAAAAGKAAGDAGKLPLGSLVPPERLRSLAESFAEDWSGQDRRAMVEAFIDRVFESSRGNAPLLSAETVAPLAEVASRSFYRGLLPVAERILSSPAVQSDLSAVGRDMVKRAIGRLGPVQRLIVGAANYEKTLSDSMPETIADLKDAIVRLLRGREMEDKVVEAIISYLRAPRLAHEAFPLAPLFPVAEVKKASRLLFEGLGAEKEGFAAAVEQRYRSLADKSIDELLPGLAAALSGSVERGLPALPDRGADIAAGALGAFLVDYADRIRGRTVGDILALGEEKRARIAAMIADGVVAALSSQAERLVEALDVKTMVVDKLDQLDMAEIERIILQVVDKELNWITILGGILGGIIGVFQSLVSLL
ncbi:DUF445 family protein [bacterium]|nr:DUF445 family protein [bacterium]